MLESSGERSRKAALAHLALRLLNGVLDPAKGRKPASQVEQQPRRPGISVSGLADGARVQQPAAFEADLGTGPRQPADDVRPSEHEGEGDVAVADEDQWRVGALERAACGLLREDVFPDWVTRACVKEIDPINLGSRRQPLEEVTRPLCEHPRCPACCGSSLIVEVAHAQISQHDEVVVPDETDRRMLRNRVAALVWKRPVPDGVTEAPDCVDPLRVDLVQDRRERMVVTVDVGYDGDAHG